MATTTRKPAATRKAKSDATDKALDALNASKAEAADGNEMPIVRSITEQRERAKKNRKKPDWVWVPEFDSAVQIRRLSAGEHEDTVDYAVDPETDEHSQLRQSLKMIELGCVDPKYTEEDFEWLSECEPTTLHILVAGISILTGLRGGAIEDLQNRFHRSG